ncbi:hypothetical protein [Litorilituus sediminis]|uniref:Uncharacterized protein n=1 Tax=Litorilituus sediminis TaxID=718192 RepID=A0A4P6P0G6_9GAMM|nr:hypothetical protein [Litorilituus sediminis]QBG34381.1 hypothetical protein EMK97_00820 [Litorilituus sediminis]
MINLYLTKKIQVFLACIKQSNNSLTISISDAAELCGYRSNNGFIRFVKRWESTGILIVNRIPSAPSTYSINYDKAVLEQTQIIKHY